MNCSVFLYLCQTACLCVHSVVPEGGTSVRADVQTASTSGLSCPHELILKEKLNDAAFKRTRDGSHVCSRTEWETFEKDEVVRPES